jgi:hypothetical protein
MPPKRKSPAAAAQAVGSPRKTRSMTCARKRGAEPAPAKAAPAKKKEEQVALAAAEQKGRKRDAPKKEEMVKAAAEPKGRKMAKKEADSKAATEVEDGGGDGKRVIVEAW